jgi:hypothetical protein
MLSFHKGVRVGVLKIEESEVLCTNSTALLSPEVMKQII